MKVLFSLVTIISAAYLAQAANCTNKPADDLKTYIIDLDAPPATRFQQTAIDFRDGIVGLVDFQK